MNDVIRIAVYGPESTGKTMLAEKLAAHFAAPLVPEYAREYWDAQGGLGLEDMLPVAREQWRREDAAAQQAALTCNPIGDKIADRPADTCNLLGYKTDGLPGGGRRPLIICDTDALTTMLWSDLLYGTTPDELRRGAEQRCRRYALYLLLDIDVPFADDPQRCFPDPADREKCRRVWHGALERRGLPYEWIRGDWAERECVAIAAIEKLLAGRVA